MPYVMCFGLKDPLDIGYFNKEYLMDFKLGVLLDIYLPTNIVG